MSVVPLRQLDDLFLPVVKFPTMPRLILHLRLGPQSDRFLHPFRKLSTLDISNQEVVEGRYGAEPRLERIAALRNDLYLKIEDDVRAWMADRRFVPRFLAASAVFLLVFLFAGFLIRDMIPLIDEVLLGTAAGIGTYLLLGRQDLGRREATQKRAMLRATIDAVKFTPSELLRRIEERISRIRKSITEGAHLAEAHIDAGEEADVYAALHAYLNDMVKDPRFRKRHRRIEALIAADDQSLPVDESLLEDAVLVILLRELDQSARA